MPYDLTALNHGDAATTRLRMAPFACKGWFGWLHAPVERSGGDTGVVLCSGLTHDKLNGHRSLRELADALADDGYPTVRFDYPGTGDSRDPVQPDHWNVFQQSIDDAIDWLREQVGVSRIVLVGVRIGATLAAMVAERRDDVAALLLMEPVLRGRSFLRQLQIDLTFKRDGTADMAGGLDAYELLLSPDTVRQIATVDLREVRPRPPCRVAIFSQSTTPILTELLDGWRTAGIDVACEGFDGLEAVLRPSFLIHEGSADTRRVRDWISDAAPQHRRFRMSSPVQAYVPLSSDNWVETPIFFGARQRLFGIICRPCGVEASDLAVVLLNSSGDPHYGCSRLSVALARRLAEDGVTTLRMDFAGLGDACDPGEDGSPHLMDTDRSDDIRAALDALQAQGFRRFALQGLCTGAYHALHGALTDKRVGALLLFNLPAFEWHKGEPLEVLTARGPMPYLRGLRRRHTWVQMLQRGRNRLLRLLGKPDANVARRAMESLYRRNVRVLFLYAASDVGLTMLERELGTDHARVRTGVVRILSGFDHSFSRNHMRKVAGDLSAGLLATG